ncbi:MAG: phosphate signaling complex protein PhoU [Candidatus Omnitrophota bacterium]
MVMERHFDDELSGLKTDLIKMASLVEESIYKAVQALKDRNKELAEEVVEMDSRIDEMENIIEENAIELLALRQPMAADLRFVTTGMRINAELERIADLTVNIAQRAIEISDEPLLKPMIDIPKLSEIARKMVKGAIDSFVDRDEKLAREIILTDPQANMLKAAVQKELIGYMTRDGSTAARAVPLILSARHLERICDHATNIAEDVIYMVQAKVVKHRKLDNGE